MIITIGSCVNFGISPTELMELTGKNRWIWVDEIQQTTEELKIEIEEIIDGIEYTRAHFKFSILEIFFYKN